MRAQPFGQLLCLLPLLLTFSPLHAAPAPAPLKPTSAVEALLTEGQTSVQAAKWQEAERLFRQALEAARAAADQSGEAEALTWLGRVRSRIGQPQQALEHYRQVLPLRRAVQDKRGETPKHRIAC